jgi:hypothetical protein
MFGVTPHLTATVLGAIALATTISPGTRPARQIVFPPIETHWRVSATPDSLSFEATLSGADLRWRDHAAPITNDGNAAFAA